MIDVRIAFFGGSFDPPHCGHLEVAKAAVQRLDLDEVWMAPAGSQPLKLGLPASSYTDRLAMVRLATEHERALTPSAADAPRADGRPNYTIDVLLAIRAGLSPTDRLFCLLGADAFLSLRQWHRALELLFVCEFLVAARPGFPLGDLFSCLPEGATATKERPECDQLRLKTWTLADEAGGRSRLHIMPDLDLDISATQIRRAIAGEGASRGVLPPAVLRYIREHGLYR